MPKVRHPPGDAYLVDIAHGASPPLALELEPSLHHPATHAKASSTKEVFLDLPPSMKLSHISDSHTSRSALPGNYLLRRSLSILAIRCTPAIPLISAYWPERFPISNQSRIRR